MTIRQVITFRVKPGAGPDFVAKFSPIVASVRKEPGCLEYQLFVAQDAPETFVMLERWQDQAALEAALAKAHSKGDDPKELMKLLDGPPAREKYEV
jgi:quinol monooxygenase YgiN